MPHRPPRTRRAGKTKKKRKAVSKNDEHAALYAINSGLVAFVILVSGYLLIAGFWSSNNLTPVFEIFNVAPPPVTKYAESSAMLGVLVLVFVGGSAGMVAADQLLPSRKVALAITALVGAFLMTLCILYYMVQALPAVKLINDFT
ncbi:MAG: hypothetical protein KDA80_02385 [Planctomycetaceae bacterium]|nr:hypothetical protein [Planctomycetaceae bacterium]